MEAVITNGQVAPSNGVKPLADAADTAFATTR